MKNASAASERAAKPANIMGQTIGQRLRARRKASGLTLRALAARAGISASMISDTEHGTKSASISVLVALAEALGTTLSALLGEGEPRQPSMLHLSRAEQRVVINPNGARREHFEPPVAGSRLEFLRFVLPAGADTGDLVPHAGSIEHAHISSGVVEAWSGSERIVAQAGDTIVFRSDQRHGYRNAGDVEASLYVVIEPED
ncbi:MAG: helix-turn-helix domain-containing protein [Vulcanimicrobiaceae bacterium]